MKPQPLYSISLTRFLAFGDSITAGENGQATADATSLSAHLFRPLVIVAYPYPAQLQIDLAARYTTQAAAGQINVHNDGCPAESAGDPAGPCGPDAYDRFAMDLSAGNYQGALIMEGANDLTEYINGDTHALDRAYDALGKMVQYAKQHGVRPYLATLPPQNPTANTPVPRGRAAQYVPGFNAQLASIAAAQGADLVDVYSNLDVSLISGDGLHPTQAGYIRMAQIFFDKLKATLELAPTASSAAAARKPR